jgi:membrane protease YdiL (CAAX protease family)
MGNFSLVIDLVLAIYISWEVVRFVPRYAALKAEIAKGDPRARTRIYLEAIAFEWISGVLAFVAIGCDFGRLDPRLLGLESAGFMKPILGNRALLNGAIPGMLVGLALGTVALAVKGIRDRKAASQGAPRQPSPWALVTPDFSALIPVTISERLLWVAVSISAGICEEVVFRGWLLGRLHAAAGFRGGILVAAGVAVFGCAHAYQRVAGIILTGFAGLIFCLLYVATGSLLVPILLHSVADLRFAFLPRPAGALEAP